MSLVSMFIPPQNVLDIIQSFSYSKSKVFVLAMTDLMDIQGRLKLGEI